MNETEQIKLAEVKPYSTKELAAIYGIGKNAMATWLKPLRGKLLDAQLGYYWNVRQVKIIFEHFGHPEVKNNPKP